MDVVLSGFMDALNWINVLYVILGVSLGIVVGCIPGLSGPIAIAMVIPLTYFMPTIGAIGFLVGINKGGCFGGSISAILLNTPGAPEAAATCFDGYPLAQQGKGLKAMKTSLISSVFGDFFSTCLVILVAGSVAKYALKMGPAELLSVLILAMTLIAALESESFFKGVISAALGILCACIGMEPVAGQPRFSFGLYQLESGLPIATIGVGLLAVAEIIRQCTACDNKECTFEDMLKVDYKDPKNDLSFREMISLIPTLIRSALIGSGIGACPGLGSTVACFLSYGVAEKAAKPGDKFRKGEIKGVCAPETANNAVVGAALIPLFTLGIPGSVAASLLVGAFIVHGITPGPLMFEEHGRAVYGVYGSMIIGNLLTLLLGLLSIRVFMRVLDIPKEVLFPIILFICIMGAYAMESDPFAVYTMAVFGFIGYMMRVASFSIVTFIIGFVLGGSFELSLQQTLLTFNGDMSVMFTSPIALFFNVITILFVSWNSWTAIKLWKTEKTVV